MMHRGLMVATITLAVLGSSCAPPMATSIAIETATALHPAITPATTAPNTTKSQPSGCSGAPTPSAGPNHASDIFAANARLKRTINIGGGLEVPFPNDQGGLPLDSRALYLATSSAGFTAIRFPINFAAHAPTTAPFQIEPQFWLEVDSIATKIIECGMVVIINMHNFGLDSDVPAGQEGRFEALWQQIAEHYQAYPDEQVYFELLNEPGAHQTAGNWNNLIARTIPLIRAVSPARPIIVEDLNTWDGASDLFYLRLPVDANLILTFHYYEPHQFTSQGAEWITGSRAWLGTTWEGTPGQTAAIAKTFDQVMAWAEQRNRPVFLGEFGTYSTADQSSRVRWATAVRQAAEQRGFSWGYWELCNYGPIPKFNFGINACNVHQWNKDLLRALIPSP